MDIIFIGNKAKLIDKTPHWKIDRALRVVKDAYAGRIHFAIREFIPDDPSFDHTTCKEWRANLNEIRRSLALLYRKGYVNGYYVDESGNLVVRWFEKYTQPVREIRTVMRTAKALQRAEVFAIESSIYEYAAAHDCTPIREPYHTKMWRVYQESKDDYQECIATRMSIRKSQVEVLEIIQRAYREYDLDTLRQYDAPLSCLIADRPKAWEKMNYDN